VNAIRNLWEGEGRTAALRAIGACLFFASLWVVAGREPAGVVDQADAFRRRAELEFEAAQGRHLASTNSATAAWEFGRAAYDLADYAGTKAERESIATRGVAACRHAIALDPESAPAHYYLALNLGQLARVHLLKGLGIVSEMEKVFLAALKLDPLFDYAGSDRALGLLYHQAPGWPLSLGSRAKANRHLNEAVRLRPDYPGNRIALAEFLWETRQVRLLAEEWERIQELIPRVQGEFTGPKWEPSWVEWRQRLAKLRPHAESLPRNIPRHGDDR
jgi:tetratricopeptide (TPR) repeat protein